MSSQGNNYDYSNVYTNICSICVGMCISQPLLLVFIQRRRRVSETLYQTVVETDGPDDGHVEHKC